LTRQACEILGKKERVSWSSGGEDGMKIRRKEIDGR
jgi:hypothetical protein